MTENISNIKALNEFYLSPLDCYLINKQMNNKYKLIEVKELPIKKIVNKKRKKIKKNPKNGKFFGKSPTFIQKN